MSVAHDLHRLGTEIEHLAVPIAFVAVGILVGSSEIEATGVGMLLVLIWGNITYQSPHYRWRVDGGCSVAENKTETLADPEENDHG